MGNGRISVKGGSGSDKGGGGGSGGRLIINYLRSYLADSYPNQSFYWRGAYDLRGGLGGAQTSSGSDVWPTDG